MSGTSPFQIRVSFDKFCSHLFTAKIYDFCASLGDACTWVPARKLHTRPGYINTRIFPGLFASPARTGEEDKGEIQKSMLVLSHSLSLYSPLPKFDVKYILLMKARVDLLYIICYALFVGASIKERFVTSCTTGSTRSSHVARTREKDMWRSRNQCGCSQENK